MKVIFVCGNLSNGGAQRSITIISEELSQLGYDTAIIAFYKSNFDYHVDEKVRIRFLCDDEKHYKCISEWKRLKLLRKVLKDERPNIAIGYIQGGYALFLASLGMNFIKVATLRNHPKAVFSMSGLRGFINRLWFNRASFVIVQNKMQVELLKKYVKNKTIVIPNAVKQYEKTKYIYRQSLQNIIMIGRLTRQKNYLMVLYTLDMLIKKNYIITLNIYGKGEEEDNIKKKIKELNLDNYVSLHGWTDDIQSALCMNDLYVLTSDYEGMPNSLLEAMSIGIPCISTDCETGPSDIISNGIDGYLVPVGDSDALFDKIEMLIMSSEQYREQLGYNAKKKISQYYAVEKIVEKWDYMIKSI